MGEPEHKTTALRTPADIVEARRHAKSLAAALGFGMLEQVHVATALSELARNALEYAGGGEVTVTRVDRTGKVGIEIVCRDSGPGISNVARVLQGGYTTGGGLGRGVSGAKALMDEFQIETGPSQGTTVVGRKWRS